MFKPIKKTFESDNEGPNKANTFNNDTDSEYSDKEKSSFGQEDLSFRSLTEIGLEQRHDVLIMRLLEGMQSLDGKIGEILVLDF